MCGILGIFGLVDGAANYRSRALTLSKLLRHRGPDWSGIYAKENVILAHERLAIVDLRSGAQPLYSADRTCILGVNGEIYNHEELRKQFSDYEFSSESDCEVILPLFQRSGVAELVSQLRGMFAFILYEESTGRFVVVRDHIGIIPLYMGWGTDGSIWFASELKVLSDNCANFIQFPPGHVYDSNIKGSDKLEQYYHPQWAMPKFIPRTPLDLEVLRDALIKSVESHLMSDAPFGVLLSGGLDSSLIASIAARICHSRFKGINSAEIPEFAKLRSFSVGLVGSPDLVAAKQVADFLGTSHYEFTFTIQDGLDALPEVIYHLETFDVTTVRASTPMYLMARKIKASGVKMVLSGEGADEVFGGYLYFHKAPNARELHEETVQKIGLLHKYDCLRANKAMSAWGVEARVPFLDRNFLDVAMMLNPEHKMTRDETTGAPRMEKFCLRQAFDTPEEPYLPKHVLWRQKEQFSDGVGYSWIDSLKEHAETHVSDTMMDAAKFRFHDNCPQTKEAYVYRKMFESHFPQPAAVRTVPSGKSIACSTPNAVKWDAEFANMADPSGRAVLGVHNDAYEG